jgi:hypothetical protein
MNIWGLLGWGIVAGAICTIIWVEYMKWDTRRYITEAKRKLAILEPELELIQERIEFYTHLEPYENELQQAKAVMLLNDLRHIEEMHMKLIKLNKELVALEK